MQNSMGEIVTGDVSMVEYVMEAGLENHRVSEQPLLLERHEL